MPPTPLADAIRSMIDFFQGFEYSDTAIVMTHGDYLHHKPEFTVKNGMAHLGDIPIYQVGILNSGIVRLTTLQEAERILCCIERSLCPAQAPAYSKFL